MTTTLPRDLVSLLAAVDASPDDTTPQLAIADWCDEQDSPWVKCPKCGGDIPGKRCHRCHNLVADEFEHHSGEDYDATWSCNIAPHCSVCSGEGSVQDRDLRDKAAYIRVSVELAKFGPRPPSCTRSGAGSGRSCPGCLPELVWQDDTGGLRDRLDALLAANLPRWVPAAPCPGCGGNGTHPRSFVTANPITCPTCGGSGDALTEPNQWGMAPATRITPDLDFYGNGGVPWPWGVGCRLSEVGDRCGRCGGDGWMWAGPTGVHCERETCGDCEGSKFRPSPWALAVLAACPTVRGFRVTDREPYQLGHPKGLWCWHHQQGAPLDHPQGQHLIPSWLCAPLARDNPDQCDNARLFRYPTAALARRALSRALYSLVAKGGTPP